MLTQLAKESLGVMLWWGLDENTDQQYAGGLLCLLFPLHMLAPLRFPTFDLSSKHPSKYMFCIFLQLI